MADAEGKKPSPLDDVIAGLRAIVESEREERDALRGQIEAIEERLRRSERALAQLTGEAIKPGPSGGPRKRVREKPAKLGEDRVAKIEAVVRELASENDEFRQVDVRQRMSGITSGMTALAFEQLRQKGVIRFARQDGNNKWFRLTRQAVNGDGADEEAAE